jgi:transposase
MQAVDGDLLRRQDELPIHTAREQQPMSAASETAIRDNDTAILVSFELSQSSWVLTIRLPGSEKMSRHSLKAGNTAAVTELLARQQAKAERLSGQPARIVTIYEAGLDGFWLHRWLCAREIESHVVDAASIAAPRRKRNAKSDGIDGETLLRTLASWRRREPRVCSMVAPPTPEEEDRRRVNRERAQLLDERIALTNRIKGLLTNQGISDFKPLKRDCRVRLAELRTGDGRPLPQRLNAEIGRMLDRLERLQSQIRQVEAERDALLAEAAQADPVSPVALLLTLNAIGPEIASGLGMECFYRHFDNRRQVASFVGLAPTPWRSGRVQHEQGISKAGRPRLRKLMLEAAWLWLRYQPGSALSQWFRARTGNARGREKRIAVVALARKLLVALWRFVTQGVVPEGATLKAA